MSAAIQEDVDVLGVSLLSGVQMTVFPKIMRLLKERGVEDMIVVAGGVMPDDDVVEPGLLDDPCRGDCACPPEWSESFGLKRIRNANLQDPLQVGPMQKPTRRASTPTEKRHTAIRRIYAPGLADWDRSRSCRAR